MYSIEGWRGSSKLLSIGLSYYCDPQRSSSSKESLCTLFLLTSFYLSESQIELTVVETLLENIIESPPLKGWTRRRSPGALGELLIKLVLFTCLTIMFSLIASVSMYSSNLIDPLHK